MFVWSAVPLDGLPREETHTTYRAATVSPTYFLLLNEGEFVLVDLNWRLRLSQLLYVWSENREAFRMFQFDVQSVLPSTRHVRFSSFPYLTLTKTR